MYMKRCANQRGIIRRLEPLLPVNQGSIKSIATALFKRSLTTVTTPQKISTFVQSSWVQYKNLIDIKKKAKIDQSYIKKIPIDQRLNDRPTIGSFVEFKKDDLVKIGVITSDEQFLFNANNYQVFTAVDNLNEVNNIETITSDDIRFHLKGLIKPERLFPSLVDSDGSNNRTNLNKVLKDFIHVSFEAIQRHHHLIPMIQAYYSKTLTPVQLNLLEVARLMRSKTPNSERSPSIEFFMFGLHLHFQSDPWNFTVIDQNDYLLDAFQSDAVPKGLTYLSNSIYEAELLDFVSNLDEERQLKCNEQLKEFLAKADDSVFYEFLENPNDKRFIELRGYIMMIRQYLRHPHPEMHNIVKTIAKDIVDPITPQNLFDLLRKLYVFPSRYTQLQDSYALPSITLSHELPNFNHLRKKHYLVSYGLPSLKHIKLFGRDIDSELAVSLDNTNRKHWKLNIHIPDIASILRPNDPLVSQLLNKGFNLELPLEQVKTLFDERTMKALSFKEGGINRAITLTIDYNVDQNHRWNTTKASLSLTELKNFKKIPMPELNEIWKLRSPNISNFFQMLMSFPLRGDRFSKLTQTDRDTLDDVFTMVDYWFFKRGESGSMEYQIPSTKLVQSDDYRTIRVEKENMEKFSYLEYILKEIDLITSEHLHQYSSSESFPLIAHDQSLVDGAKNVKDFINITSSQFTVPDYTTAKFEELIYPKDSNGFTPLQNYITAIQFLKPSVTKTTMGQSKFSSLGLKHGYINFTYPMYNIEGILNQWQVVAHLQQKLVSSLHGDQDKYEKYELNELYPKNYTLLTSEGLLQYYHMKIEPLKSYQKYLSLSQDRYLRLRQIEDDFKEQQEQLVFNWDIYRCVILKPIVGKSVKAWCFDLSVQVDIVFDHPNTGTYQIGDQIICNKILSVSPVESSITLRA